MTQTNGITPFSEIHFKTKDGENCKAIKNNGIVTVQGDKNGVRQMPLEAFMKYLVENAPKLERTPSQDTFKTQGK